MGSEEQARHRATRRYNANPDQVGVALTRQIDVTDGRDIVVHDAIGYDGHRYLPFRTGLSGTEASGHLHVSIGFRLAG